jgi:WD40 repeat protein
MSVSRRCAMRILAVTAAVISFPVELPAQQVRQLVGREIAITPDIDEERLPQGPMAQGVAAMLTSGGDTIVTCVSFSPDGKTLAFGDGFNDPICTLGGPPPINPHGGLIRLIDLATRHVRMTLGPTKQEGHEYTVRQLWFSTDGRTLISDEIEYVRQGASRKARAHFTVWDVVRGKRRNVIAPRDKPWSEFDLAPDGLSLVVIDDDGTVQTWDTQTGKQKAAYRAISRRELKISRVKYAPDSRPLAFICDDGSVTFKDAVSGREIALFPGRARAGVTFTASVPTFSADGRHLAAHGWLRSEIAPAPAMAATAIPQLRLFDVVAGRELARPRVVDGERFSLISFTPDSKTLVGADDAIIRVWDAATGDERASFKRQGAPVFCLSLSPDGTVRAVGEWDRISLSDLTTGKERALLRTWGRVDQIAFQPDGTTLTAAGGILRLWDLRAALAPGFDEGHCYDVTSLAYSPDGKTIASGSEDNTVKIWDLRTRKPRATLRGHEAEVTSVVYAPDGTTVISGSWDRTVRLWDAQNGIERAHLIGHTVPIMSVAVSPDGRTVASVGDLVAKALVLEGGAPEQTAEIKIWDVSSGRVTATPLQRTSPISAKTATIAANGRPECILSSPVVTFSRDGATLAIGNDDGTVYLWDINRGVAHTLPSDDPKDFSSRSVLCLSYSPDGRRLAAGRRDATIRVWEMDPSKERQIGSLKYGEFVLALAFSPDGKYIAGCDRDKMIKLWSVGTWQEAGRLESGTGWFTSLAFSPDGKSLAAGNRNADVLVYPLDRLIKATR